MNAPIAFGKEKIDFEELNRKVTHIDRNSLLEKSQDAAVMRKAYDSWDSTLLDEKEKKLLNGSKKYKVSEKSINCLESDVLSLSILVDRISNATASYKFGELSQLTINTLIDSENKLSNITSPYRFTILSSENNLEHEVHQMVMRANEGFPPQSPYFPHEWENIIDFMKSTYGKYLKSCDGTDDCLFLDNLRAIHPDGAKISKLKKRAKQEKNLLKRKQLEDQLNLLSLQMNSAAWGGDVAMALYNYFRGGRDGGLTSFIKRKSDRGNKEREILKLDSSVLSIHKGLPAAHLKKQYLLRK